MWYYQKDGAQEGPVAEETVDDLIAKGEVNRSSLVWQEGMSGWQNVMDTGLKDRLKHAPPPVAPPVVQSSVSTVRQPHQVTLEDAKKLQTQFNVFWIGLAAGIPLSFILVGIGGVVLSMVFFFIMMHKFWSIIQDGAARTTPGKAVGFWFIPVFNFYWFFVAFHGLAKDMNQYVKDRDWKIPEVSEGLALTYCILSCCSVIPLLGVLAAVAGCIIWILTMKQLKDTAIGIIEAKAA